ncbi:MBL fold metallo-hydrolase [Sphingomonas histidinilytica]|nr:MBL fold metallo-hydrolase [Rhizorhabdus histidinilytica]
MSWLTRRDMMGSLTVFGGMLGGGLAASPISAGATESRVPTPPGPGPSDRTTRLVTLGTVAGPRARVKRSGSANLLQVGDGSYLIDAGPGVSHQLAKTGLEPADIHTVFLTHLHFDHVAGLASMLVYAWFRRRGGNIDIYGPPATSAFVQGALQYLAIPEKIYAAEMPPTPSISDLVRAHDFDIDRPSVIFHDDKVRVTAVENTHYATIPADHRPIGARRTFSYRFDTPDRSIVFTGDTGPSDAVVDLARGADILVAEVMNMDAILAGLAKDFNSSPDALKPVADHMLREHLSPQEVGLMAKRAGVKMVILTHVGPGDDAERDMRMYTSGVRQMFSGPVVIANDGDEY